MKVLLINPNRMKPPIAPIGLEYVAQAAQDAGHNVRALDLCFSEDVENDLLNAVHAFQPEVIGISIRNTDDCYFTGRDFILPQVAKMVETIKSATRAAVVLGGVGFSVAPVAVLRHVGADYGIPGDGEEAFVAFLKAMEEGNDPAAVPGVLALRHGEVIGTRLEPSGEIPSHRTRGFFDNRRYFTEGGQGGFETKRGCGMNCIYCADPVAKGRKWRLLPPEAVVEELRSLLDQGVDCFHTCDSEFNLPDDHAKAVCRAIITAGLSERITWYAYCAPSPFDSELADLMRRAGCVGMDFGVDSADDDQLRRLGRHFNSEDLTRAADLCGREGFSFMFDLLIGGPGETEVTVRRTIEAVKRIGPSCMGASIGVRVYPGTQLAEMVRREGPISSNSALHGAKDSNDSFVEPIFYLSPNVGLEVFDLVEGLIAGDERFFLACRSATDRNYNYNDNSVLVQAIRAGARGAYWDILRRLRHQG